MKKKKKIQEKIKDLENKWKRALADYDNLQKRIAKEKEEFVKFANACLLEKLLGVWDELNWCQEHLKNKGLKLVCQRFEKILKEEGVEEIKALGEKFDPKTMEAVEIVEGPQDRVVEVALKGYLFKGKVLRPAKVKVGGGDLTTQKRKKGQKVEKETMRGDYV